MRQSLPAIFSERSRPRTCWLLAICYCPPLGVALKSQLPTFPPRPFGRRSLAQLMDPIRRRPAMAPYSSLPSDERQHLTPKPAYLSGWKEIANYLGKGVRTVQRYERDLKLPVRRLSGLPQGSVMAACPEIDQWVSKTPRRPELRAASDSRHLGGLKRSAHELFQRSAEGNELTRVFGMQSENVRSSIERIVQTLSGPALSLKMKRHQAIAAAQKENATDMIAKAREMSARAINMRKPPHRRVLVNC